MAHAPSQPAAIAVPRDALRIVLFGRPGAGKSSLLGALAQAAESQRALLHGRLTDLTQGLAALQHRLYDGTPQETVREVAPYPATWEPLAAEGQPPPAKHPAVFVDCDGRVANDLLERRRTLDPSSREGTLVRAVLEADALVLVVDAAAESAEVDAEFAEFVRFLRLFEQSRGRQAEVGGLPVFLVLSKCDLLAEARDTPAAWMERIEERKRQVGQRFREFLDTPPEGVLGGEEPADEPEAFGSIDLHLWATAVKRPALAGSPAQPREPYGVAELFRQVLAYAQAHRERRVVSTRRLAWTVLGSTGLVGAMLALALSFLFNRPEERPAALLTKIDSYRSREGQTVSARLREPLQPRLSELTELRNDPQFDRLPPEVQQYVTTRVEELRDYQAYKEQLHQVRSTSTASGERDLQDIETSLNDLALPAAYREAWAQTEAALYREQRLKEVKLLRAAVAELEDWYRRLIRRGEELWTFSDYQSGSGGPLPWALWHTQVASLFEQAESPPHRPTDRLPGATTLTYSTVFRFDRVAEARAAWLVLRQRLQRLRDLSAALGLAGKLPGRPPLLDLPAPPHFTADLARVRLQELERTYPRFQQEFVRFDLPDAVVGEVERAARRSYDHAIEAGREVVLRHLLDAGDGRESPEAWRRLLPWLAAPQDLQAWRAIAATLARLQDPDALDPVTALDLFLRHDRFDLDLGHLTLDLPDDLKLRPAGRLAIHHRPGGEARPPLLYEVVGDGRRDVRRRVTVYTLRPLGASTLTYRPGDLFWVELPVKDSDNRDWMLTWTRNRSQVFQFERLTQPPRLHRKDQENLEGKLAEGVVVTVIPPRGLPTVPDLVPVVEARKP